jgi:hypothetical protein
MKDELLQVGKFIFTLLIIFDVLLITIHLMIDVFLRGLPFELWLWEWLIVFFFARLIIVIWDTFFNF